MQAQKPLRLFLNPIPLWTDLALKTSEAILTSMHAAAAEANAVRVAILPDRNEKRVHTNKKKTKRRAKRAR